MLSATHVAMLCPTMVSDNFSLSLPNDKLKLIGQSERFGNGATHMKAKVFVSLKPGVLDPQGKAIKHSVQLLGFEGVSDIRQGKYFEVAMNNGITEEKARDQATQLAREVLSNPIIEDFRVEIEE